MSIMPHQRMNDDTQSGVDAVNQYYSDAASFESPYTEHADEDFNRGRNALYKGAGMQAKNPRYNQMQYSEFLTGTPNDVLNKALEGYKMSPEAHDLMKVSMSALSNAMIASGQFGSGKHMAAAAEIGNGILSQDVGKFLGLEQGAFKDQQQVLGNFDKETRELISLFQGMIKTESGASKNMADNAMRAGHDDSMLYGREATQEERYQPFNQLASMLPSNDDLASMAMFLM